MSRLRKEKRLDYVMEDELFSTLTSISRRRNIANLSISCRYFHGKCLDVCLHQLIQLVQAFTALTRHATRKGNHPQFFRMSLVRKKFHIGN